ncbi:MAG: hypothetical protein AAF436_19295 [Myxococcota bacterium]
MPKTVHSLSVALALASWFAQAVPAHAQQTLMASPTCEELTIMDFLARLDDESRRGRLLTVEEQRNLSQVKRDVCAPFVGYRVTRQPVTTWTNGRPITRSLFQLNYPNGRIAKNRRDEWFFPSGPRAKSGLGTWKYANGMLARTPDGIWYTQDGRYVEDPEREKRRACEYLGRDLCPLGKAEEDLLTVTVMGLINMPSVESEESSPGDTKDKDKDNKGDKPATP